MAGSGSWRTQRIGISAAVLGLLGGLVLAAPVAAVQSDSFLSMSSDTGDYVGQGVSYDFTPSSASFGAAYDGSLARFSVITPGYAEWWYVTLAAPPGQPLVPGTYTNAVRAEFRAAGQPGIDVYGDGRGCNTDAGSFTVRSAVYDPSGSIVQFDATFEQHCEGATPALRGEIRYDNSPVLSVSATINGSGTASRSSGRASVGGTVSCSFPTTVSLTGTVSEPLKKGSASGSFSQTIACGWSPVSWTAVVASTTGKGFVGGTAQVHTTSAAADAFSGQSSTSSSDASVTLALTR